MHKLKKVGILEEEIRSQILDHRCADNWEQAAQISADIKEKEAELVRLKKKISK